VNNLNLLFETSIDDDLDSQPTYEKPVRVSTGQTRIAPNTQGKIIESKINPPELLDRFGNTMNAYPCHHYHTPIGYAACQHLTNPVSYCKFHDNVASCRYYCRRLNVSDRS